MKKGMTFIVGFIIGMVAIYTWGQIFNNDSADTTLSAGEVSEMQDDATSGSVIDEMLQSGAVEVSDQPAGKVVQVTKVDMPKLGWVVVHEIKDGVIANALGASLRDAGEHSDITVYLLRDTTMGGEYAVMLYEDDGDREFSLTADVPVTLGGGDFVMSKFKAS